MTPTRETLYDELYKVLHNLITDMGNVDVASHYVRLLERKNPKAVKILCKNFNCIFNNEELELIGKMARAIFNDLIPDYINKTEDPTTGENGKKVSNIIPFPKRA